ncbi:E3 ubiquitin-protein ligase PDZRN3 [Leptopilina heterotoma]|uniref:E3 ubiquitin-protein ligase PDZRN3 n=1 Tax=Leptopilina heterotoma TaxID=63436 RepID=UPI001CA8E2E1|nr:E3 ubiquitin-protein ligase PDZRN3 [Leptopilina heterotoma]
MDFIILKVNGQDVSTSSHEDAIRCFQLAEEPIIVEVLRRHPSELISSNNEDKTDYNKHDKNKVTAASDDDDSFVNDMQINEEKNDYETGALVSTAVQTDWSGLIEEDYLPDSVGAEEQVHDFLTHDIDFEEVTLEKNECDEKLGLTVCYSSASGSDDADTEVYISEIIPESLAARDGRLREGDQLLQVNGKDVINKEQTLNLFAETKNAVTILVSRNLYQSSVSDSPEHVPAYQNTMIEQLIRHQQHQQIEKGCYDTEEKCSTSIAPPPVPSHTLNNTSQNSHKPNKSPSHFDEQKQRLQDSLIETTKKMENLNIYPQFIHDREVKLMDSYSSHIWSDNEHIYETIPESDTEPLYSFPYEHQNWLQQKKQQNQKPILSSSKSNSSGEEKDSSSAYNTGESCHSNPLTLQLHQAEKDHHKSTLVLCSSKTLQSKNTCTCPSVKKSNNQFNKKSPLHCQYDRDNSSTSTLLADTMYTNVANLQQTMIFQQQLFKEALTKKNNATKDASSGKKSKSQRHFQAPSLSQYQFIGSQQVCAVNAWIPPEDKCEIQMEWKVKRRADGTRYIARRPVRSRRLKNRALKISEERAGNTTEDDTISEIKLGRYWSKEERKKQLEQARERKRQQQELISQQQSQQNNDLLIFDCDEKSPKKPLNIVELSQRKLARKKIVLDDFTTVQEMLVHGSKMTSGTPGSSGKLLGLLSVTTV